MFWKGMGQSLADFAQEFPRLHILVSQIRDGFTDDSQGGVVRLRSDGAGVLDYPLTDFVKDGIRRSYLAMAECQYAARSEEHTSELQSLMRISYAVFCFK